MPVGPPHDEQQVLDAGPFKCTLRDCVFDIETTVEDHGFHIDASEDGTKVTVANTKYDPALCLGTDNIRPDVSLTAVLEADRKHQRKPARAGQVPLKHDAEK